MDGFFGHEDGRYMENTWRIPSGKLSHNYGKSPCCVGKSTISMGKLFNSYFDITRGYKADGEDEETGNPW